MTDLRKPSFGDLLPHLARGEQSAPRVAGEVVTRIACPRGGLTFGRDPACDVVLDDPAVSPRHAALEPRPVGLALVDRGSDLGTFVNGRGVRGRHDLRDGDLVQLGPYQFRVRRRELVWVRNADLLTLAAAGLGQAFGAARVLDDVALVCRPGEFVGLLGPSGAGKSTLLNALAGLRPAQAGHVYLNGQPLYPHHDRFRHLIGYVPQDDLVHPALTARQALGYVAELRFPGLTPGERQARVEEALAVLELGAQAELPVGALSGGQRKRVNVGVELLGRPGVLFLDEPTAGLDPGTEAKLMRKFRQLAHQGRVVVCATHIMENVDLLDRLVVLVEGGRLAFFGTPAEARAYFGVERFADLYDRLEENSPEAWQDRFRASGAYAGLEAAVASERSPREFHRQTRPRPPARATLLGQAPVLTRRFARTLAGDAQVLRQAVVQPVLLAALMCLVFRALPTVLFLLAVTSLWMGCALAAQQVVKERAIYRRERLVNLRRDAYVLSKFAPLALVGAFQGAAMLAVVWLWRRPDWDWPVQLGAAALASWNGVALGLLISAAAASAERATSAVLTVMLPQIVLAGLLVPLPELAPPAHVASHAIASRWANEALAVGLLNGRPIDEELLRGEGNVWALWNLYPEYELNKPEGQAQFLSARRGQAVRQGGRLALDGAALAGLIAVQLLALRAVLR